MKRRNEFDVYAVSEGKVLHVLEAIRENDGYASKYGLRVLIIHPDGSIGWYCHLSKVVLKEGDIVKAGSIIGKMGNTGMDEQTYISSKTLEKISKYDPELHTWLLTFKKDNEHIILKDLDINLKFKKKLQRYLVKHLHLMLTPDKNHLHGKYALNPLPWLFKGVPPVNTCQSKNGGWKADYEDENEEPYYHEGIDFSGQVHNIIKGWNNFTDDFQIEFFESIDRVA